MIIIKPECIPSGRFQWQGKSICPLWISSVKKNTKNEEKKGAFYSYFYISLWCYLFDKFNTTLGIPCHWPISHLAFLGTFRQIWAADKCMAPSYLFCPNPAPLLPWPGPCWKKALNVLPIFFFHSLFFGFPKDIHTFSWWEAEQIVLGGWMFVVLIYGDVGCPEAVGVLPTQQSREFAIFLLFPLFFIPSTAHSVLTPSSFAICSSSSALFLL